MKLATSTRRPADELHASVSITLLYIKANLRYYPKLKPRSTYIDSSLINYRARF